MIDFATLIAQIHEKRVAQPMMTQNIQMMRFEPCKEDPSMNMIPRNGMATGRIRGS